MKTRRPLTALLSMMGACSEAQIWAQKYGTNYRKAWLECPQADWMMWLALVLGVDLRVLTMAAAWCVIPALRLIPKGERRSHDAVWAAVQWARREISGRQLRRATKKASEYTTELWDKGDFIGYDAAEAAQYVAEIAHKSYRTGDAVIASLDALEHRPRLTKDAKRRLFQTKIRKVIPFSLLLKKLEKWEKKHP